MPKDKNNRRTNSQIVKGGIFDSPPRKKNIQLTDNVEKILKSY